MAKATAGTAGDKEKEAADDNDTGKGAAGDKSGEGTKTGKEKAGDKSDSAPKTYTQDEVDALVAEARRDQRRAPAKPAKSEKAKKAKSDDDEEEDPELIKERQRREQLEEKLRVREAQDAVVTAARNAGFANPEKIYRLVKDDLTFDDEGKPDNVKDLIALAKRDYAEELKSKPSKGSADGGAGSAGEAAGTNASMNDFIRRTAGRA